MMRSLLSGVVAVVAAACAVEAPPSLVIRAGRVIDGSGAPARDRVRILVKDGSIAALADDDDSPLPAAAAVIDLGDLTLLPGLVNAHAHLFSSGACDPKLDQGPFQALRNLHADLQAGVTTVADLGAPAPLAIALRRFVGTARHRGPRVLVSGPVLTAPGGYPIDFLGRELVDAKAVVELAGPEAAVAVVRGLAAEGVDFIKVALQEVSYNGAPLPLLSPATLCATVKEAHRQELRVLAHAITARGYALALECGVDALMHGAIEPLADDLIAKVKDKRTPVAPTIFVFAAPLWGPKHLERLDRPAVRALLSDAARADLRRYAAEDRKQETLLPPFLMPGISRARAEQAVESLGANTGKLAAAGVELGLGTDAATCFDLHGSPVEELLLLEQAGLSRLAVLRAATWGGARLVNLHDAVGLVQVGYRADLIAVAGRPDLRLTDVTEVRRVFVDGVEQRLEPPGIFEGLELVARLAWAAMGR
ncbi:MAG: amidohydrolase family protein [Deltaproteobacteria bacterium]|nr:amidohydrolase family protein [Deltaproteobacteria bacterium]